MENEKKEPRGNKKDRFLTTEHFALQTARSAAVVEANGRANLFVGTVSSAIVALAFIAQVSKLGDVFFIFTLVLFPTLVFLGIVTCVRVLQTGIEDIVYARGINRIRHYYVENEPELEEYFILSTHDDIVGAHFNMGVTSSKWQGYMTMFGMIAGINSVLLGVFTALLVKNILSFSMLLCIVAGVGVLILSVILHQRYQSAFWIKAEKRVKVLFPSPKE